MNTISNDYQARCDEASADQGIDELVKELKVFNIHSEIVQSGGFNMVAYIPLHNNSYIYAGREGASHYNSNDELIEDILVRDDEYLSPKLISFNIADFLDRNGVETLMYSCTDCGLIYLLSAGRIMKDSPSHDSFICDICQTN